MGEHSSNLKLISLSTFSYKQNCYTLGDSTKKMFVYGCIHFPCESWYIYIQKYTYTYFNFKYIIIWCIHHDVYIYICMKTCFPVWNSASIWYTFFGQRGPLPRACWRMAPRKAPWHLARPQDSLKLFFLVAGHVGTFFSSGIFLKSQRNRSHSDITWWLIPLSKWVITPVINGISRLIHSKNWYNVAPPSCVCWFRFAPVTSSLFAYHKP